MKPQFEIEIANAWRKSEWDSRWEAAGFWSVVSSRLNSRLSMFANLLLSKHRAQLRNLLLLLRNSIEEISCFSKQHQRIFEDSASDSNRQYMHQFENFASCNARNLLMLLDISHRRHVRELSSSWAEDTKNLFRVWLETRTLSCCDEWEWISRNESDVWVI
jgi:inorganic triphosphatase YgiF